MWHILMYQKLIKFLKNIGLTPGTGSGCFQSSQDIVPYTSKMFLINVAHFDVSKTYENLKKHLKSFIR